MNFNFLCGCNSKSDVKEVTKSPEEIINLDKEVKEVKEDNEVKEVKEDNEVKEEVKEVKEVKEEVKEVKEVKEDNEVNDDIVVIDTTEINLKIEIY